MEKKKEEMIIKLQALLRGWLVRRHHQQQKAAVIRFQAGNIIPLAYYINLLLHFVSSSSWLSCSSQVCSRKACSRKKITTDYSIASGCVTCFNNKQTVPKSSCFLSSDKKTFSPRKVRGTKETTERTGKTKEIRATTRTRTTKKTGSAKRIRKTERNGTVKKIKAAKRTAKNDHSFTSWSVNNIKRSQI